MKVEKRGDSYRVRKTINKRTYSFTFDHRPTKLEVEAEVERACPTSSKISSSSNFRSCAEKYVAVKDSVLSASTKRGYQSFLRNLPDWFMSIPLRDLGRDDVQMLVNDYSRTHAPKGAKNMHAFVSAVLDMYKPDLKLNTTLPQAVDYQAYVPTPAEIRKVLEQCYDTRYWICLKLGTYSLRRSEICALKYPDDIDGRTIHISKAKVRDDEGNWIIKSTKTKGSTRDVVISQEMADRINKDKCFYDGYPDSITENLHRFQDRAKVPRFRFHDLRGYFATEMSKEIPEADWLAMGGWSSDYVAKKVYRKSRIKQNQQIQLEASKKLESL